MIKTDNVGDRDVELWERGNIELDLGEIDFMVVNRIELAQYRAQFGAPCSCDDES
jgi:hypothetical protein